MAQRRMPPGIKDLPIGIAPEEWGRMSEIGSTAEATAAPAGPVRAAAEWDETLGVFCLWDNAELMDQLQMAGDVIIITQNSSWWNNWLNSNGIPTGNFSYLNAQTDTWWVRDYGPWFIWDGNGDFGIVNNVYNRPRPHDDVIPLAIANAYGVPYYAMDLQHTGGNYAADGYGRGFSSLLVYKENPSLSEAAVRQMFVDYLGIDDYLTLELDYDIEHFDTFGKPVAPDTIVWGEFPEHTTPWFWSEAALRHYEALQSPYGWPYKIHRLPLWDYSWSWTAYVNSFITAGFIVVPSYNSGHDNEARSIFQAAAPGYQVVFADNDGTFWGDSIHCRTRNLHRGDGVRIYPAPHWETAADSASGYEVRAEILCAPATQIAGRPQLRWTVTGGAPFSSENMAPTGTPNEYAAEIPAWPAGTTIRYYIAADDMLGNSRVSPPVAPGALFTIEVVNDNTAPTVEHITIQGCTLLDWPPVVECVAMDDCGIPALTLEYKIGNQLQSPLTMDREEGTFRFSAQMSGNVQLGDRISYRIVAADGASNERRVPAFAWEVFTIDERNRVLVIELDETPGSGTPLANRCADFGLNVQYTTEWPTNLSNYDLLMICLGMQPGNASLTSSQANALASFLNNGGAAYMEGGNAWAQDSARSIYNPYFGVASASSGSQLTQPLLGVAGQVTEGVNFTYDGERKNCDHLTGTGGTDDLLTSSSYVKALFHDGGTFLTVASSFQIGDLVEGATPNHGKLLTGQILDMLGQDISLVVHESATAGNVTVDLYGQAGTLWILVYAAGPGYLVRGNTGVVHIDRGTAVITQVGMFAGDGHASVDYTIPADSNLTGLEVYFQAAVRSGNQFIMTNPDRVVFD
jgi:agmatine/peptidylarginine deiminase